MVSKGGSRSAPKGPKLTSVGQAPLCTGQCIATSRAGKACCAATTEDGVPYCKKCMRSGDPALHVAAHPKAGKILCASRALPKGYKMALWGRLKKEKDVAAKAKEWAFVVGKGIMLDPTSEKGSMVQYCACAGPGEVAAVTPESGRYYGGAKYGCWVFRTNRRVPKSWQLTMQYGDNSKGSEEFFAERGIKRCDVGTKGHPAFRRKIQKKGASAGAAVKKTGMKAKAAPRATKRSKR